MPSQRDLWEEAAERHEFPKLAAALQDASPAEKQRIIRRNPIMKSAAFLGYLSDAPKVLRPLAETGLLRRLYPDVVERGPAVAQPREGARPRPALGKFKWSALTSPIRRRTPETEEPKAPEKFDWAGVTSPLRQRSAKKGESETSEKIDWAAIEADSKRFFEQYQAPDPAAATSEASPSAPAPSQPAPDAKPESPSHRVKLCPYCGGEGKYKARYSVFSGILRSKCSACDGKGYVDVETPAPRPMSPDEREEMNHELMRQNLRAQMERDLWNTMISSNINPY
jgi:hypothetical protein